jgi:O-antigen ligase
MAWNTYTKSPLALQIGLGIVGLFLGITIGFFSGAEPKLIFMGIFGGVILFFFCRYFEYTVIGLLVLRSSLDFLSRYQVPALFAIGLDGLTLLYVVFMLIRGKRIKTTAYWWFFAVWVALQGLWIILIPFGTFSLDDSLLYSRGIREWIRLVSWVMASLLVLQLRERISPEKLINLLFLSLAFPVLVAFCQMTPLRAILPGLLIGSLDRIRGTFTHPNVFATFLIFFMGLLYWKWNSTQNSATKMRFLLLMGLLAIFLVSTKTLVGLVMLGALTVILFSTKGSPKSMVIGIGFFVLVIFLFGSTEFGRERLSTFSELPYINPHMDFSRAIIMRKMYGVNNSFYWRIEQWTYLILHWQSFPYLGSGLDTVPFLTHLTNGAHNDYLRALVEGGVVGFLLYFIFLMATLMRLIYFFLKSQIGSNQREVSRALLGIFVAILIAMLTENIWSHTGLFYYFFVVNGILDWDWEKDKEDKLEKGRKDAKFLESCFLQSS